MVSISRKSIKTLLDNTFNKALITFNSELQKNRDSLGTFSITFDIWTARDQNAYLGLILSYIDPDFNLVYRLVSFELLDESHTGIYINTAILKALEPYPSIDYSSISR